MDKLMSWAVTIIGIVLLLPLLTLTFLGDAADWIIAVLVLVLGVKGLIKA